MNQTLAVAASPPTAAVVHHVTQRCRACDTGGLVDLHAFGAMPLANATCTAEQLRQPELRVPLTLALCPHCTLVQLRETVDPTVLFADYRYFSSYATSTLVYAEQTSQQLCERFALGAHSRVVEIASNDGYLLLPFQRRGVPVLGIEPAQNVAAVAQKRGVPTENAFFDRNLAAQLRDRDGPCDLVIANNVLAHVADLPGFVSGVRTLLRPSGHAVFEFPYVGDMIDHGEFDTIYHEHLCYFSLRAVHSLLQRAGLHIVDVVHLSRHGGSLRVFASPTPTQPASDQPAGFLAEETARDLHAAASYRQFTDGIERTAAQLQRVLTDLHDRGHTVAAYGASAKGSTLLQACAVRRDQLAFVADKSPHKHGRFMPGNHVPIVPTTEILVQQAGVLLLLTWNFADEILAQEAEYRRRGGRFLLPVPAVRFA